jgi:hypothetical protein
LRQREIQNLDEDMVKMITEEERELDNELLGNKDTH